MKKSWTKNLESDLLKKLEEETELHHLKIIARNSPSIYRAKSSARKGDKNVFLIKVGQVAEANHNREAEGRTLKYYEQVPTTTKQVYICRIVWGG